MRDAVTIVIVANPNAYIVTTVILALRVTMLTSPILSTIFTTLAAKFGAKEVIGVNERKLLTNRFLDASIYLG